MEKKAIKKSKKSEESRNKVEELTNLLKRSQADFDNYKKKCAKDYENMSKNAARSIIQKLLPVLDSFDLGLKHAMTDEEFIKGMILVHNQLKSVLESEGLRPIDSVGKKFDPYKHEVMLQETSDKEEGIILEDLQKGYMLHDQVLRHTKVKVSKSDKQTNATK